MTAFPFGDWVVIPGSAVKAQQGITVHFMKGWEVDQMIGLLSK